MLYKLCLMDQQTSQITQDHSSKVPELRKNFYEKYQDNIKRGQYDPADLERVDHDDIYLCCFLQHQRGSVENALNMMDTSLKWRKDLGLNDLTDKSFPRWMHDLGGCYYHNHDKEGHRILYFQVSKHKKDAELLLLQKKFVAWWIDKHFLKRPGERLVVLFDMCGAGFTNMDIELVKFQISCFSTYYPFLLEYMLVYEMQWILNTIWKVIKNLLSAEQQKFVIFVKKAEIQQYINKDQLFVHMGGTDTFEYKYLPPDDSGIDLVNGDLHTPTEEMDDPTTHLISQSSNMGSLRKRVTFAEHDHTLYTSVDDGSPVDTKSTSLGEMNSTSNSNKNSNEDLAPRKSSDTSSFGSIGSFVDLLPSDELKFIIKDPNSETLQTLTINNVSGSRIAFKVKTTAPEKFRVRPSSGIVKIGSKSEVSIHLQPGHEDTVVREKFLVMIMQVADTVRSSSQVADQWKAAATDSSLYSEYRLRCLCTRQRKESASDEELAETNKVLVQKMNCVLESQQRLEANLEKIQSHQKIFMVLFIILAFVVWLAYYVEVLPVNKYNVNACVPNYLS